MKLKIVIWSVLIGFLSVSLHAQLGLGEGTLKGIISDETGRPVSGAGIEVVNTVYRTKFTAVSDTEGRWMLSGLASALYEVTVKKAGYQEATIRIQLSLVTERVHTLDITLKYILDITLKENEQGISTHEGSASAGLLKEGNDLFTQKRYQEALAKFEEYKRINPDVHKVSINIGNCLLAMKEYARAIQTYLEFIDRVKLDKGTLSGDEDAATVLATIGQAYLDQENIDEAKKYFKLAIDSFPGDPVSAYNLGEIYFNQGEPAQAIDYLLIAIKIDKKWPPPYQKLGYAYLNKGQYQKALESFKKFLELAPDDPLTKAIMDLVPQVEQLAKSEKK